jgi:hypothetical protein
LDYIDTERKVAIFLPIDASLEADEETLKVDTKEKMVTDPLPISLTIKETIKPSSKRSKRLFTARSRASSYDIKKRPKSSLATRQRAYAGAIVNFCKNESIEVKNEKHDGFLKSKCNMLTGVFKQHK